MRRYQVLLMVLFLTACGGSDDPTSPVTPEPPEEPEPPVEPEPEPEPIVVFLATDSARFEGDECEYDVDLTARGDGVATWTGMDVVWYRHGTGVEGTYDRAWVADWLGPTLTAADTVLTGLITMPDSLRFELHYQRADSSVASVSGLLRCPR